MFQAPDFSLKASWRQKKTISLWVHLISNYQLYCFSLNEVYIYDDDNIVSYFNNLVLPRSAINTCSAINFLPNLPPGAIIRAAQLLSSGEYTESTIYCEISIYICLNKSNFELND